MVRGWVAQRLVVKAKQVACSTVSGLQLSYSDHIIFNIFIFLIEELIKVGYFKIRAYGELTNTQMEISLFINLSPEKIPANSPTDYPFKPPKVERGTGQGQYTFFQGFASYTNVHFNSYFLNKIIRSGCE